MHELALYSSAELRSPNFSADHSSTRNAQHRSEMQVPQVHYVEEPPPQSVSIASIALLASSHLDKFYERARSQSQQLGAKEESGREKEREKAHLCRPLAMELCVIDAHLLEVGDFLSLKAVQIGLDGGRGVP